MRKWQTAQHCLLIVINIIVVIFYKLTKWMIPSQIVNCTQQTNKQTQSSVVYLNSTYAVGTYVSTHVVIIIMHYFMPQRA